MRLSNGDVLLRWPLAQHIITAGWTYNDGSLHRALDFRATVGTPVYAAESGTVAIAYHWNGKRTSGDTNSYGNMIKLKHTTYKYGTLETLYAHLNKIVVKSGQQVQEGQLIGYSGDTGNCYGAHLHFEVRWKGQRTNPLNWLDGDFTVKDAAVQAHLGRYTSVERPKLATQTQRITIGRISSGDRATIRALCEGLGLISAGLYRETCADGDQWMLDVGPVSSGDAWYIMRKCAELQLIDAGLYHSQYAE